MKILQGVEVKRVSTGRGLVSTRRFNPGQIICSAPVTKCLPAESKAIEDLTIWQHTFVKPAGDGSYLFVWGPMTMCNHRDEPTCRVIFEETDYGLFCHLVAIDNIGIGVELTTRYENAEAYNF